jgi:hypothetical protein
MDVTRVSKTINAPLRYVYAWCTDFREDDPQITGSTSQRKILEKTRRRAIYAELYEGADGKQKVSVEIITLRAPTSWHLDYFGEEEDETGEYRLKSMGRNKTRLDMVFKEKWKNIAKVPSLEERLRRTNEDWDKYVAALEKDYDSQKNK